MSHGTVYLVGAGPGNPELITLRGFHLLQQADVILHDRLIPTELLRAVKPTAEVICVGKSADGHGALQEEINVLIVKKALAGQMVLRLKGGDCYLFGRGGEEAQACSAAGVPFEVVPGITSALAVPAYAGIPPTHREFTPHVAIITGHRQAGKTLEIPKADTLIFLMSVGNIAAILDALQEQGWPPQTPIAAIERGTCYDQRVVTGKLDSFRATLGDIQLRTPAVFVVGKVVDLQPQLDWFGMKKNILVLGNYPQRYEHLGNIIHRRIIECVPVEDSSAADATLNALGTFDWICFTSVNTARFLFERLYANGLDARALGPAKVAAIGHTTAERLKAFGLYPDLIPQVTSSGGLLEAFAEQDLTGKKVLLPRAEVASKTLPEGLRDMGAEVRTATFYKTIEIDPGDIDFDYIDAILFTSGSTVRAFVKRFDPVPGKDRVQYIALGKPTQAVAREHGIDAELMDEQEEEGRVKGG